MSHGYCRYGRQNYKSQKQNDKYERINLDTSLPSAYYPSSDLALFLPKPKRNFKTFDIKKIENTKELENYMYWDNQEISRMTYSP